MTTRATVEKAAVMARVSTGRQLDNTSPDEQLRRGREYCAEQGYEIVAEHIEAMSGAYVLARTAIIALLEEAEKGRLDVIIFDVPDRLGRGDAISQLEMLAKMSGARIEFARPGHDRTTTAGLAQHHVDQLVSGIERLNIGRRTREGKQARARQGQYINTIFRPLGYQVKSTYDDHGHKTSCFLVLDEGEAAVIRDVYQWYVYEGMSIAGIAKRLGAAGVPTWSDRQDGHKSKTHMWYACTVRKILHSKTYAGEWQYGKRSTKRVDALGKTRWQTTMYPESEWITVPVPAIVSLSDWEEAQRRMEANRHRCHKPTRHEYLLRGRVRCSRCGLMLIGSTVTGGYQYYRCRRNHSHYLGEHHCNSQAMPAKVAEAEVWAKLTELMQDREKLMEKVRADREETMRAHRTIQTTITALLEQDRKALARLDRYLELYGEGGMTKAVYGEKKRQVDAEIEHRATERADLQAQLATRPNLSPDVEAEILRLADDAALGMAHATFAERVRLLDLLRVEGIYNDHTGELTITGSLGTHTLGIKPAYDTRCTLSFSFVLPLRQEV